MKKLSIIAASVMFVLGGCGGSDGSGDSSISTGTKGQEYEGQGQFIDAAVAGLHYTTSSSEEIKVTDAEGNYDAQPGDTVTFYLGGINGLMIGKASAASIITPLEVTDSMEEVTVLAQILQTLGGSSIDSGFIQLPDAITNIASTDIELLSALQQIDLNDINTAQSLFEQLNINDVVTADDALEHFLESLNDDEVVEKRGEATVLPEWKKSSNTQLASISVKKHVMRHSSKDKLRYIHIDNTLTQERINSISSINARIYALTETGAQIVETGSSGFYSEYYAKLYLSCLDAGYVDFDHESKPYQCVTNTGDRVDVPHTSRYDLPSHFAYRVAPPQDDKKGEVQKWGDVENLTQPWKCIVNEDCTPNNLNSFSVKSGYDHPNDKRTKATHYDSSVEILTATEKQYDFEVNRTTYGTTFMYLVKDGKDRQIDLSGTWRHIEKRTGCSEDAHSSYTFSKDGVEIVFNHFDTDDSCELIESKESATYSEMGEKDWYWFTDGKAEATLGELNASVKWCDDEQFIRGEECEYSSQSYTAWAYKPLGKNWDQGVLTRTAFDADGRTISVREYQKIN